MKTVFVVVISVVCSLVAVFGALIGYELYLMGEAERIAEWGAFSGKLYEKTLLKVQNCIPRDKGCFNYLIQIYDYELLEGAEKYKINTNTAEFQELEDTAHYLLKVEYDYLNEVYNINSQFDSYYYGSQADRLVNHWQRVYQNELANMRLDMNGNPIDVPTIDAEEFKACLETTDNILKCY